MRNVLSGLLILVAIGGIVELKAAGRRQAEPHRATRPAVAGEMPPLLIPVRGVEAWQLKDSFNEGRVGHQHNAIDILAPRGTEVLAAVDGVVRKLFLSGAGGITLYQFDQAGERSYYYAHLDGYAPGIHEGQMLRRGDVIGYVGTTGNAPPDRPHLHFAIHILPADKAWSKGEAIDPYPILTGGATQVASAP